MGIGIDISLEEAASGVKREIVYDRLAPCPDCGGTGVGEGGSEAVCPECSGTGRVVTVQRTFLGDMQSAATCSRCQGSGHVIEGACEECEGQGRVPDRQRVSVEIPAGIRDGQQLRVSGFGEAGMQGARSGDLIVSVRILPHEHFERDGHNLHASVTVPMVKAALGAEVEIDGIMKDETVSVRIPEGSQSGDVVRVRNHGMRKLGGSSRGDMYVHLNVEIPKKLSKREREILEELAYEMGEEVLEKKSPLRRIKDTFN